MTEDLSVVSKDPVWIQKKMNDLSQTFGPAEKVLHETTFSLAHEDSSLNLDPELLHELNMAEVIQKIAGTGLDNYVLVNSFTKNKCIFKGWLYEPNETLYWLVYFGPGCVGPPTGAHGGALAAVLDQLAGFTAVLRGWCLTAELKMTYKSLVPIGQVHLVETRISNVSGRKVTVSMSIHNLPKFSNDPYEIEENVRNGGKSIYLKTPNDTQNENASSQPTCYIISPPKTTSEALMMTIQAYPSANPAKKVKVDHRATDPAFAKHWTLGTPLPKPKSKL